MFIVNPSCRTVHEVEQDFPHDDSERNACAAETARTPAIVGKAIASLASNIPRLGWNGKTTVVNSFAI